MRFTRCTKPRKDLDKSSHSTRRKRTSEVRGFLDGEAGTGGGQIIKRKLLRQSSEEEREYILKDFGLCAGIDAKDGLAMIANMNTTWYAYKGWGR